MDSTDACRFYTSLPTEDLDAWTLSIETEDLDRSNFAEDARRSRRGQGPAIPLLSGALPTGTPETLPNRPPTSSYETLESDTSVEDSPTLSPSVPPQTYLSTANASRKANFKNVASLPDEIILDIMTRLEGVELYTLQQTSSVFSRIFGDERFTYYHNLPSGKNRPTFKVYSLSTPEIDELARVLQKDLYCEDCVEYRESSDWQPMFDYLQDRVYCETCLKSHPRFLFPRDAWETSQAFACIGRVGRVSLCTHSTPRTSVTWHSIELADKIQLVCDHPSHLPSNYLSSALYKDPVKFAKEHVSLRPRMVISKQDTNKSPLSSDIDRSTTRQRSQTSPEPRGDGEQETELTYTERERATACKVAYAWDVPLLDIDQESPPTVKSVHKALLSILEDRLKILKPCKHVLKSGHLSAFIRQGVCPCFLQPGQYIHPFSKDSRDDCFCLRERYLTCRDCGSVYAWYLAAGHIMLLYRYIWNIHLPTSPAWCALLEEESYESRVFGRETRFVIWCDSPGCAGGTRRRFESWNKERAGDAAKWREGLNDHTEGRRLEMVVEYWNVANR